MVSSHEFNIRDYIKQGYSKGKRYVIQKYVDIINIVLKVIIKVDRLSTLKNNIFKTSATRAANYA